MSACKRDGSRPEVEDAKTTSAPATRLAAASSPRFTSSRSGALSCTNSTDSAASSGVGTNVRRPSAGSGASVSLRKARRALSITSPTLRGASGAGSKMRTSIPLSMKRAAQPPPITPPPSRPTSVTRPQPELLAHLLRPQHLDVHPLEDLDRPLDELSVRRERPAREVDVVLQPHAHVAAGGRRHRAVR